MTNIDHPDSSPVRESGVAALMGIGEVAAILDAEFGGVSVSKIRYFESRGLIAPVRTRGGSRRFSHADVELLRTILTWQRRDYLPLDVVGERLDRGIDGSGPSDDRTAVRSLEQTVRSRRSVEMDEAEFLRRAMCTAEAVAEMRRHGLLTRFDATGLQICAIVTQLRDVGIEPRHLRWLRQSADREVALVTATVPLRPGASAQAAAEVEQSRRRLAAELTDILALVVRASLDEAR